MRKLHNQYLRIKLIPNESFIKEEKDTYNEMGIVIDVANDIPRTVKIGSKVKFDSWLAKKFPAWEPERDGEWDWHVQYPNIIEEDDGATH
jgi:hypothetical protein